MQSWAAVLRDLKRRGLPAPTPARIADIIPKRWSGSRTIGRMVAYYAFPKEHWRHLRTTNVIESPFAAVRLRTTATKRFKKVENATALIWKTLLVVEHHFRKLNAPQLCTAVYDNVLFHDGICAITPPRKLRAA